MQRSTDRIYTTHVGSLARPRALLDLMKAPAEGRAVDPAELADAERRAVTDVVARQRSAGLDVVSDGEQGKTGFYAYVRQRLSGFESRPGLDPLATFRAEIDSFPEYYEQYLKGAMTGGMVAPAAPVACTGPVSYVGQERLGRDLDTLAPADRLGQVRGARRGGAPGHRPALVTSPPPLRANGAARPGRRGCR